jgi:hypothetical protein
MATAPNYRSSISKAEVIRGRSTAGNEAASISAAEIAEEHHMKSI